MKPSQPDYAKPKNSYHHGDLKKALVAAGLDILAKDGADALTLREAARRAKVSHAAPYRHFSDKDALLAAIAEEGFNELNEDIEKGIEQLANSPLLRWEEIGWQYIRFALKNPDQLRVMFGGLIPSSDPYPGLKAASYANFALWVEVIRECQSQSLLAKRPPQEVALSSWALVHGLAMLYVTKQLSFLKLSKESVEATARGSLQMLLHGLV